MQTYTYTHDIPELIKSRRSCRNFRTKIVAPELLEFIHEALDHYGTTPFGTAQRFLLLEESGLTFGRVPGTYGVIKGAQYLIVALERDKNFMLEDLGFALEKIILLLTDLGLGSCWMGGTFQQKHFQNQIILAPGENISIVVPFGYSTEKSSMVDQIFRKAAASDKRKPLSEICFYENLETAVETEKLDPKLLNILNLMRLAPSASNRQPWRLLLDDNGVDFYLKRTPKYRKAFLSDLQRIDMGIAMAHFEMACQHYDMPGQWIQQKLTQSPPAQYEYSLSWQWQR